jgi:DNA-binding CsgD family transcriptional regulator
MFANKPDLLAEINSALTDNDSKEKDWNFDLSFFQQVMEDAGNFVAKNPLTFFKRAELKRLKEKIERLEGLNSQLACIVHFLFQKVSDLADRLSLSSPKQEENLGDPMSEPVGREQRNSDHVSNCKPRLTKREVDVFNLLSKGLCAKEIAKILFISETTVITHKRNLKEKFHAKNTVELISNVLNSQSG